MKFILLALLRGLVWVDHQKVKVDFIYDGGETPA